MKPLYALTLPILAALLAGCSGYTEPPACRGELFSLNADAPPAERVARATGGAIERVGVQAR